MRLGPPPAARGGSLASWCAVLAAAGMVAAAVSTRRPARAEGAPVPVVQLQIKTHDYGKLQMLRDEAVAAHETDAAQKVFVPATLTVDGHVVHASVRLKGDLPDHLRPGLWSLRVKVHGGAVLGVEQLNLQHPSTRRWLAEYAFMQALDREDVLAPRHQLVLYSLNGAPQRPYYLIEHFAKQLIEGHRRREGVIVKLDESGLVTAAVARERGAPMLPSEGPARAFGSVAVTLVGEGHAGHVEDLARQGDHARRLLDDVRRGVVPSSEAFDVGRLASWLAVSDLFGAQHGLTWNNVRFYFDPITGRLEPIGWDGNAGECDLGSVAWIGALQGPWDGANTPDSRELVDVLLRDPATSAAYAEALERVSSASYVQDLDAFLTSRLAPLLPVLQRDPEWSGPHLPDLAKNAARIRADLATTRLLDAWWSREGDGPRRLILRPRAPLALEVRGFDARVRVPGVPPDARSITRWPLGWKTDLVPSSPLGVRLAGTSRAFVEIPIRDAAPEQLPTAPAPLATIAAARVPAPFTLASEEGGLVATTTPGEHAIEHDVELPPGVALRLEAGTTLRFARDAVLVAHGPLDLRGRADAPVRLLPRGDAWEGIFVLAAHRTSHLEHVVVSGVRPVVPGAKGARRGRWSQTGGVVFFESDLEADHLELTDFATEDAINVVRSHLVLHDAHFARTSSDALDCDFVAGEGGGARFVEVGGDAIDVSGTTLAIDGVTASHVSDKVVSVGEASDVDLTTLTATGAHFGVASKDGSVTHARDLHLRDVRFALAAYQKKPEYAPGHLTATAVEALPTRDVLAQDGSEIVLDGVAQPTSHFDWEQYAQ